MRGSSKSIIILFLCGFFGITACHDCVDNDFTGLPQVSGLPDPPIVDASSSESVKNYVAWLGNSENGFIKRRSFNQFSFEALIEPPAYAVLLNHRGERITNDTLNEEVIGQSDLFQMQLTIANDSTNNGILKYELGNAEELQGRMTYYSFEMDKDVFLVVNGDTIPCAAYQWERGFEGSGKLIFQLVFSNEKLKNPTNGFQLVFYDRVFNNGIIKFFYGKE